MAKNRVAEGLHRGEPKDELIAIVALELSRVVPPHRLSAYIDKYGSAVQLVQLSETDRLMAWPEAVHEVIGAVTPEDLTMASRTVENWLNRGVQVATLLDPQYPSPLREIFNRPPLLFSEGRWVEDLDSRSVAIVGTRSASQEGLIRAREYASGLVEQGFTVLSGLALGIDSAAHRATLERGGRTIAVMGTGLDHRYPSENADLADEILVGGGALLSQFFPEQGPRRWTFPMRNVVMSGLSMATLVIEASATSGAKMQARVALQHGRTVFLDHRLLESHKWAREYVEEGRYDTEAIAISTVDEIVERLEQREPPVVRLAV